MTKNTNYIEFAVDIFTITMSKKEDNSTMLVVMSQSIGCLFKRSKLLYSIKSANIRQQMLRWKHDKAKSAIVHDCRCALAVQMKGLGRENISNKRGILTSRYITFLFLIRIRRTSHK